MKNGSGKLKKVQRNRYDGKKVFETRTLTFEPYPYDDINDVIEKPNITKAPSNYAVIGRYILSKKIFSKLKNQKPGKGGEIHITDAIQSLIYENNKFIGHNFYGKYYVLAISHPG